MELPRRSGARVPLFASHLSQSVHGMVWARAMGSRHRHIWTHECALWLKEQGFGMAWLPRVPDGLIALKKLDPGLKSAISHTHTAF